jgi:hypothetical protein
VAFLLLTSIFGAIPVFSPQPPIDTTTYCVGTIGQPRNVDLDVTHTITALTSWPTVYVWKSVMRVGYQGVGSGGSSKNAIFVYQIKVSRSDANSGLPLLATVVGIRRDNLSASPAETFAYPNSTTVLLGPLGSATLTLQWHEDGSMITLPATPAGVIWQMGVRADVAQLGAVDSNLANNYQRDGIVAAYMNIPLGDINGDGEVNIFDMIIYQTVYGGHPFDGDINGDGIVDILDAITLAGVYGKQAGQTGYNADANFNTTPDPVSGKQIIDILDAITLANNYGKHLQP